MNSSLVTATELIAYFLTPMGWQSNLGLEIGALLPEAVCLWHTYKYYLAYCMETIYQK